MYLRLDLEASVPKDGERPQLNEDAWAANAALTCVAISDGASESYDSRVWARLLVQKYAEDPDFGPRWLSDAVTAYTSTVDYASLTWAQQGSFDRGSYATLIGLRLRADAAELDLMSIGDSLVVHVREGRVLQSFPFTAAEQFEGHRPRLLATLPAENLYLQAPDYAPADAERTWKIQPGDTVYLLTDAVGHWLLTEAGDEPSSIDALAALTSEDELAVLILKLRSERRIHLDDSTVVRLVVEGA